jgi:hypothetical protein
MAHGDHPVEYWHIYAVYDLTRGKTPLGGVVADSIEQATALALDLHKRKPGQLELVDTGRLKRKKCC